MIMIIIMYDYLDKLILVVRNSDYCKKISNLSCNTHLVCFTFACICTVCKCVVLVLKPVIYYRCTTSSKFG